MALTMQDKMALSNYERFYLEPPDFPDAPEEEKPAGFYGIGLNTGIYVKPESALHFALERSGFLIANMSTFEKEWGEGGKWFVECFYSGDWVEAK